VVGQPFAAAIRRRPRWFAVGVRRHLIAQINLLAKQAAHRVSARLHQLAGNVINGVTGGFGVAPHIVQTVPPGGVFPGGKWRFRDKVAHAFATRIFNDERDEARFFQAELDRNRRMRRIRSGLHLCALRLNARDRGGAKK